MCAPRWPHITRLANSRPLSLARDTLHNDSQLLIIYASFGSQTMADITEETRLNGVQPAARKSDSAKSQHNEDPLAKVLEWDWGTAYELLFSFHTIMRPKEHGIPAPWSAGVRKRLSQQSQADLKLFFSFPFSYFTRTPMHLVHSMDQPKNVDRFIELLVSIPDQQFSERIHLPLTDDAGLARITNKAV